MNKFMQKGATFIAGVLGLSALAIGNASAAGIDTTAVTAALTDAGTAVATVGAAVLVVHVGVKVYKYIRGAM